MRGLGRWVLIGVGAKRRSSVGGARRRGISGAKRRRGIVSPERGRDIGSSRRRRRGIGGPERCGGRRDRPSWKVCDHGRGPCVGGCVERSRLGDRRTTLGGGGGSA